MPPRGRAVCCSRATDSRWRTRGRSTSCTTRSASRRRSRSGRACLRARGTLVKAGVHGPTFWEDTPLYFKEISMVGSNAFGFETVDGVRQHGIAHYLDLVEQGRVDLTGMLTHRFAARRLAGRVHRARDPGHLQRDQGRIRLPRRCGVSDSVVLVDRADRVAVITLNRPDQRNALNRGSHAVAAGDHRARSR